MLNPHQIVEGTRTQELSVIDTILGAYGELGVERYTPLMDDEELPCCMGYPISESRPEVLSFSRSPFQNEHTTTLFRCDRVTNGPCRCGGGGKGKEVASDSVKEERLGDERVGLIDDGGVMELWEEVSIVEDDLPTISTFVAAPLVSELKLAFERRRNCFKNDMVGSMDQEGN